MINDTTFFVSLKDRGKAFLNYTKEGNKDLKLNIKSMQYLYFC